MIKKYTISFDIETDIEDKEDLSRVIATAMRTGKAIYPYLQFNPPKPEDIRIESDCCNEKKDSPRFLFYSSDRLDPLHHADGSPTSPRYIAKTYYELNDWIAEEKAQGRNIVIQYRPVDKDPIKIYAYYAASNQEWRRTTKCYLLEDN